MHIMLFVALSAIAAILFTPVNNFLQTRSASLATSNATAGKVLSGTFGKYAVLTAAFFAVLLAASFILNLVGKKASIPEVA